MLYLLDNQGFILFAPTRDDAIIQIYGFLPNNRAKIRKIIYQQPGPGLCRCCHQSDCMLSAETSDPPVLITSP